MIHTRGIVPQAHIAKEYYAHHNVMCHVITSIPAQSPRFHLYLPQSILVMRLAMPAVCLVRRCHRTCRREI